MAYSKRVRVRALKGFAGHSWLCLGGDLPRTCPAGSAPPATLPVLYRLLYLSRVSDQPQHVEEIHRQQSHSRRLKDPPAPSAHNHSDDVPSTHRYQAANEAWFPVVGLLLTSAVNWATILGSQGTGLTGILSAGPHPSSSASDTSAALPPAAVVSTV